MKLFKTFVDPVIFLLVTVSLIVMVGNFQNIPHERTYGFAVVFIISFGIGYVLRKVHIFIQRIYARRKLLLTDAITKYALMYIDGDYGFGDKGQRRMSEIHSDNECSRIKARVNELMQDPNNAYRMVKQYKKLRRML